MSIRVEAQQRVCPLQPRRTHAATGRRGAKPPHPPERPITHMGF
jgi:hypothetical protein